MHDYLFKPLGKDLEGSTAENLVQLRQVAEGWYVDYKGQILPLAELAKHMSAFANQYGGWLFFGIEEASDGSRTAGAFPGISVEDANLLSIRLREAVSSHVSSPLLYEEKRFSGPLEAIGLPAGRIIYAVAIPQGQDPPYVYSTGRIYRRLSDQSKPAAETDRHALDLLFERGKSYRSRISERLRRIPEVREQQSGNAFAYIYLTPDLRLASPTTRLTLEQFRNICRNKDNSQGGMSIGLDQFRTSDFGFAARQIFQNNAAFAALGLRWWHDGVARLEIPINVYSVDSFAANAPNYSRRAEFVSEVRKRNLSELQICDLAMLVQVVAALSNVYFCLEQAVSDTRPIYAAYELRNLFYRLPFFNSSSFIDRCKEDGIPVLDERSVIDPEKPYFDNMFKLNVDWQHPESEESEPIPSAIVPYLRILGLISWMLSATGIVSGTEEFLENAELFSHPLSPIP
jgi:hypothetical protein